MADRLAPLDALAQAELVRTGQATPLELVDAAIARIERVNPRLNAVITPLFEKARDQATSSQLPDGPFTGVPFLLKDFGCHSAGDPYHQGSRFLKELGWTAKEDTYMAAKLRAAGFIFLGKTNTPEFATMPTTEPEAYGPSRNPWNTDHSTGGSSGGAGAAVASGMVPAAHANDGGGSTRVPASECGLVGLKSTRARGLSRTGIRRGLARSGQRTCGDAQCPRYGRDSGCHCRSHAGRPVFCHPTDAPLS